MDEQTNNKLYLLIQELLKGNINALDEIYRIVSKKLYAIAISILHNSMDAEDILHDSMIQFVKKASKFRYNKNPYGWLCRITRNLALYKCRRKRRKESNLDDYKYLATETKDSLLLYEIFEILTPEEKKLIQLKYWQDLSLSEMAVELKGKRSTLAYKIKATEQKIQNFYKNI